MLEKLIDPISNILDKFVADKDLKQKLEHELKTELHRANMAQIEVNKEDYLAHKEMLKKIKNPLWKKFNY